MMSRFPQILRSGICWKNSTFERERNKPMNIRLIRPQAQHKEAALAFRQEFFDHNETVINGSELLDQTDSYEDWLSAVRANADPETVDPAWVVTDTYFALDNADRIIGIIDLRHELKGFLNDFGHSGYSVRPSERGKGYGTAMLRQIIKAAKQAGMDSLQLSVERSNEPSVRMITGCGGRYERSFNVSGEAADIYRITWEHERDDEHA